MRTHLLAVALLLAISTAILSDPRDHARAQTPPDTLALPAGTSLVPYLGPTADVLPALTNIAAQVTAIWEFQAQPQTWALWAPGLPGPVQGIDQLLFGRAYFLTLDNPAGWQLLDGPRPVPPANQDLLPGGNAIVYFGPPAPIASAIDATTVWALEAGAWTNFRPGLPSALQGFTDFRDARAYFVFVTNRQTLAFAPPPQASAIVGPAGGAIALDDGSATLEIPPGALANPVEITIRRLPAEGGLRAAQLDALPDLSTLAVLEIVPDALTFDIPATLTVDLSDVPNAIPADGTFPITPFSLESTGPDDPGPIVDFPDGFESGDTSAWGEDPRVRTDLPRTGTVRVHDSGLRFTPAGATPPRTQNLPFLLNSQISRDAPLAGGVSLSSVTADPQSEPETGMLGLSTWRWDSNDTEMATFPLTTQVGFACTHESVAPVTTGTTFNLGIDFLDRRGSGMSTSFWLDLPAAVEACQPPPATTTVLDPNNSFAPLDPFLLNPDHTLAGAHFVLTQDGIGDAVANQQTDIFLTVFLVPTTPGDLIAVGSPIATGPDDVGVSFAASGDASLTGLPSACDLLRFTHWDPGSTTIGFFALTAGPNDGPPPGDFNGDGTVSGPDYGVLGTGQVFLDTDAFATCP